MHGFGTFKWNETAMYSGNWNYNLKEGKGKMVYNDESEYNGDWKADKRDG